MLYFIQRLCQPFNYSLCVTYCHTSDGNETLIKQSLLSSILVPTARNGTSSIRNGKSNLNKKNIPLFCVVQIIMYLCPLNTGVCLSGGACAIFVGK